MKSTLLAFLSVLVISSTSIAQDSMPGEKNHEELINSIFERLELQGVDTKQTLLYGYFFYDKSKPKLEQLKKELIKQAYSFVEIAEMEHGELMLHVEKKEIHTRQSLYEREQQLRKLATDFGVSSYDGFDAGNADPAKPVVSMENFRQFMNTKKGNALFDLGIRLYDLEINEKAELVFRECIRQNIKADTSSFKLGNILYSERRVEEGIEQMEQAIKLNPAYMQAFFNLGAICYSIQQFQKSVEYYQQANKLKPDDDKIVYGIAAAQYGLKQYDKSLENCKKALQLNQNNVVAKHLLKMLAGKTN